MFKHISKSTGGLAVKLKISEWLFVDRSNVRVCLPFKLCSHTLTCTQKQIQCGITAIRFCFRFLVFYANFGVNFSVFSLVEKKKPKYSKDTRFLCSTCCVRFVCFTCLDKNKFKFFDCKFYLKVKVYV